MISSANNRRSSSQDEDGEERLEKSSTSALLNENSKHYNKSNGASKRKIQLMRNECFDCESSEMASDYKEQIELPEISKKSYSTYRNFMSNELLFPDGERRIDYVLAYETERRNEKSEGVTANSDFCTFEPDRIEESDSDAVKLEEDKKAMKRNQFETNLKKLGLELEYVEGKYCTNTHFVLVHAPFDVLLKQAEHLSIKIPVLQSDIKERTVFEGVLDRFLERFKFLTFDDRTNERLKEPNFFTAPFVAAHLNCYVGHESPSTFFDSSERSRMVYDLLIRTRYDARESEKCRIGIERLVSNGTYTAAFPLHEECDRTSYDVRICSNREMLYWNWARFNNFYKYQPLSLINKYFGSKIGIYFAWLGYYTKALFPASILGILCMFYGLSTFSSDIPSNEICDSNGVGGSIIMCPTCDKFCEFTRLSSSCIYSKLTYVFDNTSTVIFAALMSIGATLFLEGWKRYHAEIAWKWGLLDFEVDEETVRPEYQIKVKLLETNRLNPVTQQMEPYFPFKKRFLRFIGSGISVLFFLLLALSFVVGVVIYRIVLLQVLQRVDQFKSYAAILTFSTAAFINLAVILILSYFYIFLAMKLTDWECPRTQAEFDNSYTFKVFLFQFINYYSSIFYIAFIKGNLSSVPGGHFFGLRPEECDPAGCMVELVIQLAIIMCGKQFWNAFMEIAWPLMMNKIRSRNISSQIESKLTSELLRSKWKKVISSVSAGVSRCEKDYVLNPIYQQFLFDEYLEMVIQFGFVTLFVSAFPLAPLFAFLNNIIEIRIDAYKFTITTRRPNPEKAKDIGVWLSILDGISKAAVLINALIIAFTSDFIPKFVYLYVYGNKELYGYVNNSLSYFEFDHSSTEFAPQNLTYCRYRDYRNPPCSFSSAPNQCIDEYALTIQWWIVLSFRLGFVLIFEHVVSTIKTFVAFIIPDIPSRIFIQLQRQRFLARQARLSDLSTFGVSKQKTFRRSNKTDLNSIAFQPGFFENSDARMSYELKTVLRSGSKKEPSGSMRSQSSSTESYHTCTGIK